MSLTHPASSKADVNLISRNVKISYDFQIGDNKYYVVESFDGNNEICGREIKKIEWGGTVNVNNESIRKKLIKAAKQYRIFN
jgi:hypothetical protein